MDQGLEATEMLSKAKIGAFVCTSNRARSRAFYEGTLGLAVVHEDEYATVHDANGTALRISPVRDLKPQPFTVLGWEVSDIKIMVKALAAAGIGFERFEGMGQDEFGIWSPAPGIYVAWFKDPDGNLLSLSQK
jgi:catechol 2,3-dioxygenase-like lactoylglutathione lyase family enzyme